MQTRPTRRILASATLTMEALVVVFALIVAANFSDVPTSTVIVVGAVAALACVVVAGLLRHSWAYGAGWVLQVLILLSGIVVPDDVVPRRGVRAAVGAGAALRRQGRAHPGRLP